MIAYISQTDKFSGKGKITTPKLENKIIGYKLAQYK